MATIPINKGQFTLESPEREAAFEQNRGFGNLSEYKENRRCWTEFPRNKFVSEYPMHVDLELASVCNLRCPMCYTITDEFRSRVNATLMDFDLFTKLVDQCAEGGVYSIRLSFRGEAFLHPRIVDCARYAKEKGIKEVSTLTNGVRLDEKMFEEMMTADLDWITISIDGVGDTYEEIRRPAKFDRMVEKLTNFRIIRKKAGRVKPVVKVQSILPAIEENPDEFYSIFSPITDMVSANPLIDFTISKHDQTKIEDFTCPQPFQRLTIGADGLCMMCANDEPGEIIVGDANLETIYEVWHGQRMTDIRRMHVENTACDELNPCAQCYLPLQTYDEVVRVEDRTVVAEKYLDGKEKVSDLETPERWKRESLEV